MRNTWYSVDPGMRLQDAQSGPAGYFTSFALNAAMGGMAVGEVVESRADGFAPGDVVLHAQGWRDHAVVTAERRARRHRHVAPRRHGDRAAGEVPRRLGGHGLTATSACIEVAGLREGDVVWVSAAAGAVGSLAAQIAKLGSPRDRQRRFGRKVRSCSRTRPRRRVQLPGGPVAEQLRAAAPDGIDVYFDNVGGEHLEAALGALRRWGRVAMCGAISEYEETGPPPGPQQPVPGDRQQPHAARLPRQRPTAPAAGGRARVRRVAARGAHRVDQTVVDGLEHAPEALVRLLNGRTTGKTLVRIA